MRNIKYNRNSNEAAHNNDITEGEFTKLLKCIKVSKQTPNALQSKHIIAKPNRHGNIHNIHVESIVRRSLTRKRNNE